LTVRRGYLQDRLRQAFWLVPAICLIAVAALCLLLVQLDGSLQRGGGGIAFTGGPDSARSMLSSIASSMLTLTALVFSITMVVLQLTSSQFSPRVLRTFLRDRQTQATLGVFTATFVYALIALREVRGADGLADRFVPGITISVAFGLVLLSVGFFVAYIHHIANSIRLITIATRIRRETEAAIERVAAPDAVAVPLPDTVVGATRTVASRRSGVVVAVDTARLVRLCAQGDAWLRLVPRVGDYVPAGAPLMVVACSGRLDEDRLHAGVRFDLERDPHQDVAFGLRQLVDIAERALSPGVNDPTTAVQCLDQLHTLLRILGRCQLAPTPTTADTFALSYRRPHGTTTSPSPATRSATGAPTACRCTAVSAGCWAT